MLDLDAGKYAMFVWPAFAATGAVIVWMIADSLVRARKWKRELERLEQAQTEKTRP